jgi:hypothetical protein
MSDSPYVKDSEYTVNPSSYEGNRGQYLVNSLDYIFSIDTYSIVNDVVHNGELISTSTVPHGEYELTIDTYVYEPPISRYPSMPFGQGFWAVLKVAGIIFGCIAFYQMVAAVGIIGVIKTVPAAIMDLGEMGWKLVTGAAVEIFPRIQSVLPGVYHGIITLITQAEWTGGKPYFTHVYKDDGRVVRTLDWAPLDGSTPFKDYHW